MNPYRLSEFGQIDSSHGFPIWFADNSGLRLELVLEPDVKMPVLEPRPWPLLPLRFPGNFPEEAFYFFAESRIPVAALGKPGGEARISFSLEAAFASPTGVAAPGRQVVFARIRVRMRDVSPYGVYSVVHPYGRIDGLVADDRGRIRYTEDLGSAEANPTRVILSGTVAPFLRPLGFNPSSETHIGDGVTAVTIEPGPHKEAGSAVDYVRISGPVAQPASNISNIPINPAQAASLDEVISREFILQGRLATRAGVQLRQATYARATDGRLQLSLQAESLPGMDLRFSSEASHVRLQEHRGLYSGVLTAVQLPLTCQLLNVSDQPVSSCPVRFTPKVEVNDLVYDRDNDTLSFTIRCSDPNCRLAVPALGITDLSSLANGTNIQADRDTKIQISAPRHVSADLAIGLVNTDGTVEMLWRFPISLQGSPDTNLAVEARIRAPSTVFVGDELQLDGSQSLGGSTFTWSNADASVTLKNISDMVCGFKASQAGGYDVHLQVGGAAGVASAQTRITVLDVGPVNLEVTSCEYRTSLRQYLIRGRLGTARPVTTITASLGTRQIGSIETEAGEWEISTVLTAAAEALVPKDVGIRLQISEGNTNIIESILRIRT